MVTYAETGVDVDIEELAAQAFYAAAKKSWANRRGKLGEVITPFDDFSGIRTIDVGALPKGTLMNIGFDGVGTKIEFAQRAKKFDTLGYDLIAMVCDDAVVRGGEPVLVGSILDVNTLGQDESRLPYIQQLAVGYEAAAKKAGVAIINGEVAQLGSQVGNTEDFAANWGAAVVWFAHRDRLITGYDIKAGDVIVGLEETSLRSNGISLIRRVLTTHVGESWHEQEIEGTPIIDMALAPSTVYTGAIVEMFGGYDLKQRPAAKLSAVANVTGGGLPSKLGRALKPSGLGAIVDDPFDPPALMLNCQRLGDVDDREAYRTWHMGQGMIVITSDPESVRSVATKHGINSKIIGHITEEPGITINSRGYVAQQTSVLSFE